MLTSTAIPTGYATTSMSRNQEAWHTPPIVSRPALPRCPGRSITRRCARCISHFRILPWWSPLAGPAGAQLGAVSLITRAASKRKPRQSTSDRLPVWQPMLPGERNTGSPRCPTRDLVLLYSSSRCPVPIEGGAQCACGAIITPSSREIHRIVTPDLRRLRSKVTINCEHMQRQTH